MTLVGAKEGDRLEVRDMDTEKNRFLTIKSIEAYRLECYTRFFNKY